MAPDHLSLGVNDGRRYRGRLGARPAPQPVSLDHHGGYPVRSENHHAWVVRSVPLTAVAATTTFRPPPRPSPGPPSPTRCPRVSGNFPSTAPADEGTRCSCIHWYRRRWPQWDPFPASGSRAGRPDTSSALPVAVFLRSGSPGSVSASMFAYTQTMGLETAFDCQNPGRYR